MSELVIPGVDYALLHGLQERASRHGRTPAEEAKTILSDALRGVGPNDWTSVDAIYRQLSASGRTFSDSAEMLREDRDR